MSGAPLVDQHTAADLSDTIAGTLAQNVPEWSATDPATGAVDQASAALIAIVARFGEILIERLNQAPDKSFLAFLDMIGTSPLPPQPARVPLTFSVVAGSTTDGVVPAGTQVAAAPAEGETDPVIFETERELTAISASLVTLVAADADRDLIANHSSLLSTPAVDGVRVFAGDQANEHVLYVAHDALLSNPSLATLTLTVDVSPDSPAAPDARALQWDAWDGANGIPLTITDTTQDLRASGTLSVANLAQVPQQTVNGVRNRWLRCRLSTPVSGASTPAQGMVRASQLPLLSGIHFSATIDRAGLVPDAAFVNGQAIDVTRAFLPFGDKPKIGDAFYLGSRDAFGQPGASITIDVALINPSAVPSADLQLKWEAWNGTAWTLLGTATPTGATGGGTFVDSSNAFTQSKPVTFTLPQSLAPTTVNGVLSNWIRVQIVAGNYGIDTRYVADKTQPSGFTLVLSTLAPPTVSALTLSSHVTTAPSAPDAVVAFNHSQFEDITSALAAGSAAPFAGLGTSALYAAFTLPPARKSFPNRTVSLYHGVRLPPYGEKVVPLSPELSVQPATTGSTIAHQFVLTNASNESVHCDLATIGGAWASSVAPAQVTLLPGLATAIAVSVKVPAQLPAPDASDRGFVTLRLSSDPDVHSVAFETRVGNVAAPRRDLRFEYWNGGAWAKVVAADGTDRLTAPGVVELLGPADFAPSSQFGVNGFWLRLLFEPGDDPPVQLRTLLLNTSFASQTLTIVNEVIGSSDASANQQFSTAKSPVLAGPRLEVRESSETWTPWSEVTDFFGSTSQDRHYLIDHISGEVRFGDGVQGRIPPRGVGNVRMARYQTGGGEAGNRGAGTIVQMKTTVPYIESVTNVEAAEGGVASESSAALLTRAPRALRHGGRAVALEDYEDLARGASPEVARAKTVPLHDLADDPVGTTPTAGDVSVIIVPLSTDDKPVPSVGLLSLVEDRLRAVSTPTASIAVVGPLYVRVDVSVEVALASLEGANAVENAVSETLRAFLHPLTGGRDGTGWDFGRQPFLSDLYAVVSDVPGVDHIRHLSFAQVEELPHSIDTGRFLVHSGRHQIALTFVGAE